MTTQTTNFENDPAGFLRSIGKKITEFGGLYKIEGNPTIYSYRQLLQYCQCKEYENAKN